MATTGQKLLAAGPTLAAAEIGLAIAHTGFIGAVVGAAIAAVVYVAVEETVSGKDENSSPDDSKEEATNTVTQQQHKAEPITDKTPSLLYRLFNGKSTREYNEQRDEADNRDNASGKDTGTKKQDTARAPKYDKVVDLADDLMLDVDELSGKATFIVGMRRSGKTTLGVRIAEQLAKKFHIPMFVPDLEGDWLSLGDPGMLPNCVIAGHPDNYDPKAGYTFAPVSSSQEAYTLGYDILESGLQVILDMASYDTIDEAVILVISIIKGIYAWTKAFPTELCPCDIYLDEAQRFLPENLADSIIDDPRITKNLLKTYMDITAVGGKRGLTPKILSQRIAQTNNKIIAQAEVKFIMRQTHDSDVERCMKDVKKSGVTPEQIAAFAQGQGVYIGADGTQIVTHFKKRESDGSRSNTPKAATAMRYVGKTYNGPTATTVSRETTPRPSSADNEELPQQRDVAPLPQPIIPEKDNRPMAADIDLAEAIEAYNAGATSRRKLADKFGMNENQGLNLLRRIEEARTLA